MKKYFNSDTLFGIAIIIICILFFIMGGEIKGMKGQAAPGLFARLIAIVTGSFALMLVVNGVREAMAGNVPTTPGSAEDRKLFFKTILLVALYLIAWKHVHFIVCTLVFLLLESWVLKMSWKFAVIYSVVFSFGIYYIFANVFRIML